MSTDSGDVEIVRGFVDDAKRQLAEAAAGEEQLQLLDPVSPEEMAEARELLGPNAGRLAVLREARERKRGRPQGSRNRRTEDFDRYIRQFGSDPAVVMMQIVNTDPEVLMQQSRRTVTKVLKGPKDAGDRLVEVVEETLSYEGAQSLRIRCAEGLMPFMHAKKPVAVDARILGVTVIERIGGHDVQPGEIDADFAEVAGDELGEAA